VLEKQTNAAVSLFHYLFIYLIISQRLIKNNIGIAPYRMNENGSHWTLGFPLLCVKLEVITVSLQEG
jgi:hypothetical protein